MRKLVRVLAASLTIAGLVLTLVAPAQAQTRRPVVSVIQISGLLDRVQAEFWQRSMREADAERHRAIVVQLDSNRSVLSTKAFADLLDAIGGAKTSVGIWVGPARAGAVGASVAELLTPADVVGLAPGARIAGGDRSDVQSPTLGDFIVDLADEGVDIPTRKVGNKREPLVEVRFAKPSLTARTVHGVTSPGPAYALLVFGLLLAILEFATAGIGLAALTSAIFLVLAALGLGGLPVSGTALAAILFASFGFAVDVQAGAPRAWTAIGTGALLFGTLNLYQDGMTVPILWMLAVFGLGAAFLFAGLPSLIRARFSSPTIGREGFIGETGTAVGSLSPEGLVSVRGASWRARVNRATPVDDGAAVRVIGIDGLVLDVEPEEGAAKDYRR